MKSSKLLNSTFNFKLLTFNSKRQRGYIALYTVLILLAVSLVTSISITYLSIGEAQSAFSLYRGEQTLSLVEGCMEDALLKSRNNASYNGGTITMPEGSCTVSVSKLGNVWTITIAATINSYTRTVQAVVNRTSSGLTITSWKEQ